MKHHRFLRRIVSFVLCLILMCGLGLTAHAATFKYPSAYWPLHSAWEKAANDKDNDKLLSVAEDTYNMLRPLGICEDVCLNLEPKCGQAAFICEMRGDLEKTILWLERWQEVALWLNENYGDYSFLLRGVANRLNLLQAAGKPVIYVLSEDAQSPYSVGPKQGTWFGSTWEGRRSNESAVLAYVEFLNRTMDYWLGQYKYMSTEFNTAATQGGVIELAWNFSPENTSSVQKALDASSDNYINESLKTLSKLNATVLLRIGAEMNVWSDGCDPETFKQAFRKIASAARKYSNIQIVFSPNDRGRAPEDYWPGAEYVDWVGMSSYHNNASYASDDTSLRSDLGYERYSTGNELNRDAVYLRGVYSGSCLDAVKEVMDLAEKYNKPVMISECGAGYYDKNTGKDQTDFAVKTLTTFYAYVNMVYPQVKAVFYFNDMTGASGSYAYRLDQNDRVRQAYEAVTKNGSYIAKGGSALNWVTLDKINLTSGSKTLKLATYSMLPGTTATTTTVQYFVDGKWVGGAADAPYIYNLDVSGLSAGTHTIQSVATTVDGARKVTTKTAEYSIEVPGNTATVPTIVSTGLNPETSGTAYASTQAALVDGTPRQFQYYALKDDKGNETNYVKLRDLADVLDGTAAQFNVTWAEETGVGVQTKTAYSARNGQEGKTPYSGDRAYQKGAATTLVNGVPVPLQAFFLTDDQGGDYTYYKLRDLGQALGFNVGWDSSTEKIFIETDKAYNPND